MTSIAYKRPAGRTGATLTLHPQQLSARSIVDALADHRSAPLQIQYEGRVRSLIARDLAAVAPAADETTVSALVADVWRQAEEHLAKAGRTGWAHLSWFVQNAITRLVGGAQPQMARC
ncbi:hypothetical protein [Streptomyces sp. CBMA156]|uniref:hypothetical protein n=1 Tax=Streptomyces sp. CBMA156 TaxID=1930280 RepID=UPI001661DA39|nr:hypothetical protein [Streptomyces sp. CBMA156]MBD0671623.1 hypothetical protein [Streptomyces sp. CBMA156]MBD0671633.1 hypothetical protein [Streptomyces sp. CBMA156]